MTTDHARDFFEQMAMCRDAYRRLADCIYETLALPNAPRALDLGAGLGHVAARLRERGWEAYANDLYAPEDMREPPVAMWLPNRVDLKIAPTPGPFRPFEVVICTETAEHIPEAFADAVVASVALRAERHIVWSAAQPGQEWPGHINLQLPAYWLDRFATHGFRVLDDATAALWFEMTTRHAQHEYAADNFYILRAP